MLMCEWDAPEGHSGQCWVHLYAFVSYRRLSPQFKFSLSAITLGIYLSGSSCLGTLFENLHDSLIQYYLVQKLGEIKFRSQRTQTMMYLHRVSYNE
jgi:hypothetical protein